MSSNAERRAERGMELFRSDVVRCDHSWEEYGYWYRCTKCGIWQDETDEHKAENKLRDE